MKSINLEVCVFDVNYDLKVSNEDQIKIDINFKDLDKIYVEQINILGNFITEEKLIRILIVDEGDPYNEYLFKNLFQI